MCLCVCMCMCAYGCVLCVVYILVWGGGIEVHTGYLHRLFRLWRQVSAWTWSSPVDLISLSMSSRGPPVTTSPVLGLQLCTVAPGCIWVLGIQMFVLALVLYCLSNLSKPLKAFLTMAMCECACMHACVCVIILMITGNHWRLTYFPYYQTFLKHFRKP